MKKRKWSRKVAWIFGVTAVCTLGLVLLKTGHVFGKYSEESIICSIPETQTVSR